MMAKVEIGLCYFFACFHVFSILQIDVKKMVQRILCLCLILLASLTLISAHPIQNVVRGSSPYLVSSFNYGNPYRNPSPASWRPEQRFQEMGKRIHGAGKRIQGIGKRDREFDVPSYNLVDDWQSEELPVDPYYTSSMGREVRADGKMPKLKNAWYYGNNQGMFAKRPLHGAGK